MHTAPQPVIWITGASSGIGAALAVAWAERGARLILSARNRDRLEEVRAGCRDPSHHRVEPTDLSQPDGLSGVADRVWAEAGPVDILVNNAGLSQRCRALEADLDVDRALMEVNYFGTVALTRAVARQMVDRGQGRIVTVSSVSGKIGTPVRSTYSASKHALHGFMDALRAETHDQGLRVTMVCPGYVKTEISLNALTADSTPQGTMDVATERGMDPARCAEKIIRAVERGKDEVLVGGKEIYAVALARFCPGLLRRIIRKVRVT